MSREESLADPIGPLVEEFVTRYRRGERPALSEYTQRHPDLAERIREVFPTMVMMEEARPVGNGTADGSVTSAPANGPRLEQIGGYRILGQIGRGGMGVVYEAEQIALGRHVALKVLPLHAARDHNRLERFRREARAAARLHHTNIVPVFEVGEEGDVCFYAMQFIHGQPLDDVLDELLRLRRRSDTDGEPTPTLGGPARSLLPGPDVASALPATQSTTSADLDFSLGPVSPSRLKREERPGTLPLLGRDLRAKAERPAGSSFMLPGRTEASAVASNRGHYFRSVAKLGIQVADALEYAHREGIIHRDIKPSNLLLDVDGRIWVTDFGLAKTDGDALTQTGDLVGTVRYMAPERFRSRSDPRSDVYSLGLTLYELLVLCPAFETSDHALLVQQILNEDPPRLRRLDPQIPRDLRTIIVRAIEKEPARRYQSAGELAADLQRFLEDRPILARQTTVGERAWRWCKRNRGLAALATAFVLALLVGLVGVTWQWRRAEANAEEAWTNERQAGLDRDHAREKHRQSLEHEARARIYSGQAGQRFTSLEKLAESARIRPSPELRDPAISALALTDIRLGKQWALPPGATIVAFDLWLERYACTDGKQLRLYSVADHKELLLLPAGGPVERACFNPDGTRLAAFCGPDGRGGSLRVWDVTLGKEILNRPAKWPVFAFTPEGSQLVVGEHQDGSIDLYDVATGAHRKLCEEGPRVQRLAVSSDGTQLAVISNHPLVVQVRELETGEIRRQWDHPRPEVNDVVWHPHVAHLLATAGMGIFLWDARTGKQLGETLPGQAGVTTNIAFSHAGDVLASKGYFDTTLRLWDPWTGRQLVQVTGTVSHGDKPLQFSRDDRWLAFAQAGRDVGLWEVQVSREYRSMAAHARLNEGCYTQIDFSPGGRMLAAASREEPERNGIRFWDAHTGLEAGFLHMGDTHDVRFLPRGQGVFTMQEHAGVHFWPVRVEKNSAVWQIGPPQSLGQDPVQYMNLSQAGVLGLRHGSSITVLPANDLGFAPLLTGWPGGVLGQKLHFWLDRNRRRMTVSDRAFTSAGLTLSPEGRWLATWDYHTGLDIQLWDAKSLEPLGRRLPPVTGRPRAEFSPDGKWLVVMGSLEYRVYETGSWQLRHELTRNVGGDLAGPLAFRRDGKVMALSLSGFTVQLADPETGRVFANLESPDRDRGIPSILCFSPDGRRLAVCTCHVRMIHVWDLERIGELLKQMGVAWQLPPFEETPRTPDAASARSIQVKASLGEFAGLEHRKRSHNHLNHRQWRKALEEAARAVAENPGHADGYVLRGKAQYYLQDGARALGDFDRALELDADHAEAYHYRGHTHETLRRNRAALADFSAAIRRQPRNAHFHQVRGGVHYLLREDDKAVHDWQRCLDLKPDPLDEAGALQGLAWLYTTGPQPFRNPEHALSLAQRAVEVAAQRSASNPNLLPTSLRTLGAVHYRLGHWREAVDTLTRAAESRQEAGWSQFFLAMSHHRLGEPEKAATALRQAIVWCDTHQAIPEVHAQVLKSLRAEAEALLEQP